MAQNPNARGAKGSRVDQLVKPGLTEQQQDIVECSQQDLDEALDALLDPSANTDVKKERQKASIAMKTIASVLEI